MAVRVVHNPFKCLCALPPTPPTTQLCVWFAEFLLSPIIIQKSCPTPAGFYIKEHLQ